MINIKKFQNLFSQVYFLRLKQKGVTFKDFQSCGNKQLYENFFIKLNIVASKLNTLKKANNRVQQLRLYTSIKRAVSNI